MQAKGKGDAQDLEANDHRQAKGEGDKLELDPYCHPHIAIRQYVKEVTRSNHQAYNYAICGPCIILSSLDFCFILMG
jgi:hypothetical protein